MPGPNYTRLLQIGTESGLDFINSLKDFTPRPSPPPPVTSRNTNYNHNKYTQQQQQQQQQQQLHHGRYQQHQPLQHQQGAHTNRHQARGGGNRIGVTLGLEGIDPILSRHGLLFTGDMMDIHGASCSGKTLFLYAIIISTILPHSWRYCPTRPPLVLKGKAKSVLFMDLDQGFSVDRLQELLRHRIRSQLVAFLVSSAAAATMLPGPSDTEKGATIGTLSSTAGLDIDSIEISQRMDELIVSCLGNVHIFRPPDAISTLVLLRTMDQYLTQHQQHQQQQPLSSSTTSSPPPFAVIILDSISSFYWQERPHHHPTNNHARFLSSIIDAFQRLVAQNWDLFMITTSWSLPSSAPPSSIVPPNPDKTLTDAFRVRLKYRFLMQPRVLDRFSSEQELLDAWAQREEQLHQDHQLQQPPLPQQQQQQHQSNSGSLFQAQMIIPSTTTLKTHPQENAQPEVFRVSISDQDGVRTFVAPPPVAPASAQ